MSVETAVILDRAADLVEQGWTQGGFARLASGEHCMWDNQSAVCWCLSGAINLVASQQHADDPIEFYRALSRSIGALSHLDSVAGAVAWNDAPGRTQAEVVAALREAATRERSAR